MPVRLDPWQNIVGVGWGAPDDQPPAGPLISPVLWDWHHKSTITGFDRSDLTMEPNADTGGFFENPVAGDLLLAHISADRVIDPDPWPQVTISGPAGWIQLWQFSTEQSAEVGFDQTASLWYRFHQAGDPPTWTWTYSRDCPVTGGIYRVIQNWPNASPFPDALATNIKEQTNAVVTAPDFTISRDKVLLLAFIDRASRSNTAIIFPSDPAGSGSYSRRTFNDSFGSFDGHAQVVYDAEDEPGPGAIGERSLSVSSGVNTIMGHLAILGNPAP
jgi:hypothetical protein